MAASRAARPKQTETPPKVVIKIDGKGYDFPALNTFTFREISEVQRIGGINWTELVAGVPMDNIDVVVAIVVTALRRNGQDVDEEYVYELNFDELEIVVEDQEEDPKE